MLTVAMLVGVWVSGCIQTQIDGRSGHVVETYRFTESGNMNFSRAWYGDQACTKPAGTDACDGAIQLGNEVRGTFNPTGTTEVDFRCGTRTDRGLLHMEGRDLRVARGFAANGERNTMLGLFRYRKQ